MSQPRSPDVEFMSQPKLSAETAAAEAVIGSFISLLKSGGDPKALDEVKVRHWLGVVLDEDISRIGPAMLHAQRMLHGPKPE